MFAAGGGSQNGSVKASRRRPRTASITTNSLAAPRTKKLRSGLLDDRSGGTSVASDEDMTNGSISGRLSLRRRPVDPSEQKRSSLRESQGSKIDLGKTLMKNEHFSVTKLPAFPEKVRSSMKDNFRGSISTLSSYALLLTRTHAFVWPYASTSTTPEVFSFTVPSPAYRSSDPAPIGCLTTPTTASNEPGLVVVVPSTGKVVFWESASSAAAQDLFRQQQSGVEGQVGLMHGETVTSVQNAEPAGFCLAFSSGRLAHLTLRDSHDRPSVNVQFLRHPTSNTGIFGGLKNLIGSSWKKDLVAVKPGRVVARGDRHIIAATESGNFQRWSISRAGHHSFVSEADLKQNISIALQENISGVDFSSDRLAILDFEIIAPRDRRSTDDLLVLTSVVQKGAMLYQLVEVTLESDSARILKVHKITVKTGKAPVAASLQLPSPQTTAYIVLPHSVIIHALPGSANSPDTQLLTNLPTYGEFQERIEFREDAQVQIVASGGLEGDFRDDTQSKTSSCALLVKEGGVLRLTTSGTSADLRSGGLGAKSHLEQAVYFGSPSNLVDFSLGLKSFAVPEIESAALAVAADIVSSSSPFISTLQPSMDYQLKQRKNYSHKLITFLRENGVPISRLTRWKLLWAAEKLASARAIWKHCDARMKQADGDETMMNYIFRAMASEYRTTGADAMESDDTRQWLVHDVDRMQHAVYSAFEALSSEHQYKSTKKSDILEECAEVTEMVLLSLETAFAFRKENLIIYGLQDEKVEDSILQEGLGGLPLPWTASDECVAAVKQLPDYNFTLVGKYYHEHNEHRPDYALLQRVIDLMPPLEELMIQVLTERAKWTEQQADPSIQSKAKEIVAEQSHLRRSHLTLLMSFGKSKEAMKLAEKHHDFKQLCDLLERRRSDLQSLVRKGVLNEADKAAAQAKIKTITQHEDFLFETYKNSFAKDFYASKIERGQIASLVADAPRRPDIYNEWVDHDPRLWKLKWINEVEKQNPSEASKRMMHYALGHERDLWNKKVELSLGKLTQLMSAQKTKSERDRDWVEEYDKKIQNVEIQESLYAHVLPVIRKADDEEALKLAMARFGKKLTKAKSASRSLLENGLSALIRREAMTPLQLIDVLTLMDSHVEANEPGNLLGFEFSQALRVLERSMLKGDAEQLVLCMIWRRCYIRDNWLKLNETTAMDDEAVERSMGQTATGKTLQADQRLGPDMSMVVPPTAALGAGTNADELKGLYPPEKADKLAQEFAEEDKILKSYIEKGKLDQWFPGVVRWAVNSVRREMGQPPLEDDGDASKAEGGDVEMAE